MLWACSSGRPYRADGSDLTKQFTFPWGFMGDCCAMPAGAGAALGMEQSNGTFTSSHTSVHTRSHPSTSHESRPKLSGLKATAKASTDVTTSGLRTVNAHHTCTVVEI